MNKDILPQIKVGQVITADLLNRITRAVNANVAAPSTPKNAFNTYDEVGRTSTTVTAGVEFEQIDSVTFVNNAGDVIHLVFNNPEPT